MGEYADYNGEQIKIGTCEDLFYLRWDQRDKVINSQTPLHEPEVLEIVRFRFPWPDEDGNAPGDFPDHNRGLRLDVAPPKGLEHGSTQFTATYPKNGYLLSAPCPEGPDADPRISRNGYGGPSSLVAQGWRGGRLVGIARCNGCEAMYRLADGMAEEVAVNIRARADRQASTNDAAYGGAGRLHTVADRLLKGGDL